MIKLGLHHFETLVWIARLGSFRAAAERLNTTQPGISARVREIEAQLQTTLFQREGRGVVLTARGRQLVRECEPLLFGFERVLLQTKGYSGAEGVVRIGVGEIAAASCLPGFVDELKRDLPNVTLDIELDLTSRMLHNLQAGKADLAFVAGPVATPGVITASIGHVRLVWVRSAAAARPADQLPLWSIGDKSPIYYVLERALRSSAQPQARINSCNNLHTLIQIIARGQGVALLPETMVREQLASGAFCEAFPPPPDVIEFQTCIRATEKDPVILAIFEKTRQLRIDLEPDEHP